MTKPEGMVCTAIITKNYLSLFSIDSARDLFDILLF